MAAHRRAFLGTAAGAALVASRWDRWSAALAQESVAQESVAQESVAVSEHEPIIDTHQHLWDLSKFQLNWLQGAPEILRRDYGPDHFAAATEGLNVVQAVYMEVDLVAEQQLLETETIVELCRTGGTTVAAVVSGRPASPMFAAYLDAICTYPEVKGLREVLHGGRTPAGYCLQPSFIRGIQQLGERGLSFEICMRPAELGDAVQLVKACPDTQFIVDHCGNADPKAFRRGVEPGRYHAADQWRRQMEQLAAEPNTVCKISGIVASAPEGWTSDDLAPIVRHCLDIFGDQRVVFGGDWPVCLLGATYRVWVETLREIVSADSPAMKKGLWHANAARVYRLPEFG